MSTKCFNTLKEIDTENEKCIYILCSKGLDSQKHQLELTRAQIFFNVLTLEKILAALTREIGDGPCFLYIKFSLIGGLWHVLGALLSGT